MANPWDIPPKPTNAPDHPDELYAAVGKALSSWDGVESVLAEVFSLFLGTPIFSNPLQEPGIRAYGSVVSFNGRAEMLDAAAKAYFHSKKTPTAELEMKLRGLLNECRQFSGRRNDIAHGRVEFLLGAEYDWWPQTDENHCWLFLPGLLAAKRYSLNHEPLFIYTVRELAYFKDQFDQLAGRLRDLKDDIWKIYTSP
jgi:hypothetical protein